jgi:uncharacterized protein (DUF2384 family)
VAELPHPCELVDAVLGRVEGQRLNVCRGDRQVEELLHQTVGPSKRRRSRRHQSHEFAAVDVPAIRPDRPGGEVVMQLIPAVLVTQRDARNDVAVSAGLLLEPERVRHEVVAVIALGEARQVARRGCFGHNDKNGERIVAVRLAERLSELAAKVDLDVVDVARAVGTNPRTVSRWWAATTAPQRSQRERLLEVIATLERLSSTLRAEAAHDWLLSPNPMLGYDEPIDLLGAGEFRRVIGAIDALADGVFV